MNYYSLRAFDKKKLRQSQAGIVFSNYMAKYMAKMIGGGELIYHGAEPAASVHNNNPAMAAAATTNHQARTIFSLPTDDDCRIALAVGFRTGVKGWDILNEMEIPNQWTIVLNSNYASECGLDDTKISRRLEEKKEKEKKIGYEDNSSLIVNLCKFDRYSMRDVPGR